MDHGMRPVGLSHVMEPLMQIPDEDDKYDNAGDGPTHSDDIWGGLAASKPHWSQMPFSLYPSDIPVAWIPGDETAARMLQAIDDNNIPQLLRLLDEGADPNATYPLTPIESQSLCILQWSEELNTYQQIPTWEGAQAHWTLLQWASAWCRADAVSALLRARARPTAVRDGRSALDVAGAALYLRRRAPSAAEFLQTVRVLTKAGVRCGGRAGSHGALHSAARLGSARAAALLLAAGADIDAQDYSGFSALHLAIGKRAADVFDMLLNHGVGARDPLALRERADTADRSGASLLQTAVTAEWLHAARRLLAAGASVAYYSAVPAARRVYGYNYELKYTPLHLAVKTGNMEIFNSIIEIARQEQCVDCRSSDGETPLYVAISEGHLDILKTLILNGASLLNVTSDGSNALHVAASSYHKNKAVLKYLLGLREKVKGLLNQLNKNGDAPVHVATRVGMEPLIMLTFNGADIRLKDGREDGSTPLHIAAALNAKDLVYPILFESRSPLNDLDKKRRTPLQVAAMTPSKEVLLELLKYGAKLMSVSAEVPAATAIEPIDNNIPIPEVPAASAIEPIDTNVPISEVPAASAIEPIDTNISIPEVPAASAIEPIDTNIPIPEVPAASAIEPIDTNIPIPEVPAASAIEPIDTKIPNPEVPAASIIKLIDTNIPNPTQFFKEIFDSCADRDSETGFLSHSIIDYKMLTSSNDQLAVVEELIRYGHEKTLIHPVIETLLYLKWRTLLSVFSFILAINGVFVVAVNLFAGTVFYYRDIQGNATDYAPEIVCPTTGYCAFVVVFTVLIYLSFGLLVALEYVHGTAQGWAHWRRLESWVRLLALALGAALPACALGAPGVEPLRWLAAPALLAGWLALIYLFSRFPNWGYYFLMIGKVAANLAKVLLTCVFLIVAFAHSFMILYKAESPFDGPLVAFTKTLVMMTSEFEYENLFADTHKALEHYREWVRILFIAFLLFVALILMNVMLGVAVNDINDLTVTGNIRRLKKQTEILTTLEDLVYNNGVYNRIFSKHNFNKKRFLQKIKIAPATESTWTVVYENVEGKFEFLTKLPSHLHTNLILKSRKVKSEGTEESNSFNEVINHLAALTMEVRKMEDRKQSSLDARINELASEMATVKTYLREIVHKLEHF